MKRRFTSRTSVRAKLTVNRFILAGISLSIIVALGLFFYFKNFDTAEAANGKPGGKSKGLFTKSRKVVCKPRSRYKKDKGFKLKLLFAKNSKKPYQYVYNYPSQRPPKSTPARLLQEDYNNSSNDDLTASLNPSFGERETIDIAAKAKVRTFSHLKLLTKEARDKVILDMTPSKVLPPIRFIFNQDEFSVVNMDSFMEALENVNAGNLVLIEGHTDDIGSDVYNLNLSLKRVDKIRELMLQAGANPALITIKAYGEEKPLVPNSNDENRQINRRIEFKVFEM